MVTTTAEFADRRADLQKILPYLLSIVVLTGAVIAGIAVRTQSVVETSGWLGLIGVLVLVMAAPYIVSGGKLHISEKIQPLGTKLVTPALFAL